ncbi:MAG TPA: A24 family peptidase [Tepidisphaeraceae bacterium]|nr:A24 family peptidase [Tepidisphaeraceae bacterium]
MTWYTLVVFAPLLAMLLWAAMIDVRHRRIPNWLTLAIAATGLMQTFTASATVGPTQSLLGLLTGLGLTILLFALGALGGGDVKLIAAAGTWIGPERIFNVFLAAAIVGMVIVLAQATWQGRLRTLFRNAVLLLINLIHIQELGAEHAQATGASCRSVDRPLPYAVPVLIATAMLLVIGKGIL